MKFTFFLDLDPFFRFSISTLDYGNRYGVALSIHRWSKSLSFLTARGRSKR